MSAAPARTFLRWILTHRAELERFILELEPAGAGLYRLPELARTNDVEGTRRRLVDVRVLARELRLEAAELDTFARGAGHRSYLELLAKGETA